MKTIFNKTLLVLLCLFCSVVCRASHNDNAPYVGSELAVLQSGHSHPSRALFQSKYDYKVDWNYDPTCSNDICDKRARAQGAWGRLKDATICNITLAITEPIYLVVSFTGGLISALLQFDFDKVFGNDASVAIKDFQERVLRNNQIYSGPEYENKGFFGKMFSGIFWAGLWIELGYLEGFLVLYLLGALLFNWIEKNFL